MAKEQTGNYQLSQWAGADRILLADFNSDNAKIDTALKALADAVAAKADGADVERLAEQVETRGNCQILTTSYVGAGTYGSENPVRVSFEKAPLAVFIFGSEMALCAPGCDLRTLRESSVHKCTTTWAADSKSVSWWGSGRSDYMANSANTTYTVVYLCLA